MAMTKEERESLELFKNGATLREAAKVLPELTPEQLAQLDENGDWIQTPENPVDTNQAGDTNEPQ
ncbi:hypothetical protein HGG83_05165 [Thiopseudomonas denitrificans]